MAFGNPYGEIWREDVDFGQKDFQIGIKNIGLSDTNTGVADVEKYHFYLKNSYKISRNKLERISITDEDSYIKLKSSL